jgi:hypothetical protein
MEHIFDKTDGYIKNKVMINDVQNNAINKYEIKNRQIKNEVKCVTNNIEQIKEMCLKHTNIDRKFLDIFFETFKIKGESIFHIEDLKVSEYLGVTLDNIRRRLQNKFLKKATFVEGVDFIKIRMGRTTGVMYKMNYPCFEKLVMSGETEQSKMIRSCSNKLLQFILENQIMIHQAT